MASPFRMASMNRNVTMSGRRPGGVWRKESNACNRNMVYDGIGVSHQFILLFGGCIEAYRAIGNNLLFKRRTCICLVNTDETGIDKMFYRIMLAHFQ